MTLFTHQTVIGSTFLLCSVSSAHAFPPPDGDSVGIGGAITFSTTPDNPLGDIKVGFEGGAYVPIYADDGHYESKVYGAATVGAGVYLIPLTYGNVDSAFTPIRLSIGLKADATYPPSSEYGDPTFTWSNSASLIMTSDDFAPDFHVDSAVNADSTLGGASWLKFRLPVAEYHYSTSDGTKFRTLGLELNLFSDDQNCSLSGCSYNTGYWAYSVTTVPEPSTYTLMLGGLGLLGWIRRRNITKFS